MLHPALSEESDDQASAPRDRPDVRRALDGLSPVQRAAVCAHVEGRTCRELGAQLGCSKQSAHRAVRRGLANLRRALVVLRGPPADTLPRG